MYKGSDKAAFRLKQEKRDGNGGVIDEVEEHLDTRYICSPEAYHRLYAFELHDKSNAVIDLGDATAEGTILYTASPSPYQRSHLI